MELEDDEEEGAAEAPVVGLGEPREDGVELGVVGGAFGLELDDEA